MGKDNLKSGVVRKVHIALVVAVDYASAAAHSLHRKLSWLSDLFDDEGEGAYRYLSWAVACREEDDWWVSWLGDLMTR